MCGICGYIHLDRSKRPQEAVLKAMADTLAHRGPDDEGYYLQGNVALGHRRLSIIDLKTGHQPILNEDKTIVIVYNGEVYNFPELRDGLIKKGHCFSTDSDTEAVLHAYEEYGEDCLRHLNGMFAFAIWDSGKERLFLARDRFGKKPLYYALVDNQFIFGSELKALVKHPSVKKEIDPLAVTRYLAYGYVPPPLSIFKNIRKLESASKLILAKDGGLKVERYWDLPLAKRADLDLEETESELLKLLKESVRRRLISDVPLGVFLSGGIDSSSIVAMMAELMNPKDIKTFSIAFREGSFDESSDARLVAGHFGTDHHEKTVDPGVMLELLPKIFDILDEPFADSSVIPTYAVSRFTRQGVKVALGGDGGDELFLGYPSYLAYGFADIFDRLPPAAKRSVFRTFDMLARNPWGYNKQLCYARRFYGGLSFPKEVRHQTWIGPLDFLLHKDKVLSSKAERDRDIFDIYKPTADAFKTVFSANDLDRAMYIYIKTYMADDILTKVDRASMANSLEVRAPFLDTEFAEFAASIPGGLKLKDLTQKLILKDALKTRLPVKTLRKPKHGFAVPVGRWFKKELKPLLLDMTAKKKIDKEGVFDYSYVKGLVDRYFSARASALYDAEVWHLFAFEMWYDRWMG